jgi:hypothetical protein
LLAPFGQRAPHVASKRGQGAEIAFVRGLDQALDSVLRRAKLAANQACFERFERNVLESEAMKNLGGLRVNVL